MPWAETLGRPPGGTGDGEGAREDGDGELVSDDMDGDEWRPACPLWFPLTSYFSECKHHFLVRSDKLWMLLTVWHHLDIQTHQVTK